MAKNSTIENLQKVKKPIPHKTILIIILVLIVLAIIGTIKSCIEGDLDKSSNTIPSYEKEEIARMKENERINSFSFIMKENERIRDSIAIWRASLSPKEREALEKKEQEERDYQNKYDSPMNYLSVDKWSWSTGGFGSVGIVEYVTFKNEGIRDARDIHIEVTFLGESGTELSSRQAMFPIVVKAGSKKTARDINVGFINSQSSSARIKITDATFSD
jgi:hypothetical protein